MKQLYGDQDVSPSAQLKVTEKRRRSQRATRLTSKAMADWDSDSNIYEYSDCESESAVSHNSKGEDSDHNIAQKKNVSREYRVSTI